MKQPLRSELVELAMADASEEEKREATRHWFGFLGTLLRIAEDEERLRHDSSESAGDGRFGT
jgi:hypothetical protein